MNQAIGKYIRSIDVRNRDDVLGINNVKGISIEKKIIETKANLNEVDLTSYKIVKKSQFAYVADTSRRGEKIAIAINQADPCLISPIYTVFEVADTTCLLSEYLYLWFKRAEFDHYARFHSIGSAREVFDWEEMCSVELPVPSIEEQEAIVAMHHAIEARRSISDQLRSTMTTLATTLATTLISGVKQ